MSLPVTFNPDDDVQTGRNGQLECNLEGINEWNRQVFGRGAFTVAAFAEGSIPVDDAPYSGIAFDLASCANGFSEMVLGLTCILNSGKDLDFVVRLSGDGYFLDNITMEENGAKQYSVSPEGNEHITIRLNDAGTHVEFLVDDQLVYTSQNYMRFPVRCKVINIISRNIPGIYQRSLSMRLPVKKLQWTKSVCQVVKVQRVDVVKTDRVIMSCTSLAGDEIARIETVTDPSVACLKNALMDHIHVNIDLLRLLDEDGNLLVDTDV